MLKGYIQNWGNYLCLFKTLRCGIVLERLSDSAWRFLWDQSTMCYREHHGKHDKSNNYIPYVAVATSLYCALNAHLVNKSMAEHTANLSKLQIAAAVQWKALYSSTSGDHGRGSFLSHARGDLKLQQFINFYQAYPFPKQCVNIMCNRSQTSETKRRRVEPKKKPISTSKQCYLGWIITLWHRISADHMPHYPNLLMVWTWRLKNSYLSERSKMWMCMRAHLWLIILNLKIAKKMLKQLVFYINAGPCERRACRIILSQYLYCEP